MQRAVTEQNSAEISDRGVFWGLVALLFWAPWPLGSNRTWAMAILVLASQGLLLAAFWSWRDALPAAFARLRAYRWPIICLGGFVVLPWLQLLPLPGGWLNAVSPETYAVQAGITAFRLSLDPFQTQLYGALSFAYFSCFLVALLTVRDKARLDTLAMCLVLSGLAQAILGVLLFSAGAHYQLFFSEVIHDRVKGGFVYHNHMAGYMEICLSVGIGLMLARLGQEKAPAGNWKHTLVRVFDFILSPKMRLRMMLIVLVIALVLTRSRMGNAGFFAAMLIVGVVTILLSRRMAPATIGLIASLVIIDVVIVGTWVGLEKVVERVRETSVSMEGGGREESVELRQEAALYSLGLVKDFPVFGTGAGSFYNTYLRYRTPRDGYFDHAHNDYAEIAADNGLVGVAFLGGFVLLTLACGIRILLKRRSSLPRGIAFGTLMAVVALIIHSTVDFNLQLPANALTLVVVMAMVWVARDLPSGSKESRRRRRGSLA